MISFTDVSYRYPYQNEPAISNVSFRALKGEIVLCTGISGCGKTTLIRLINGLAPHFYCGTLEGQVKINGVDNMERRISEIAHDVGTLFQDPENQFFALNVKDELAFAHEWRGHAPADTMARIMSTASLLKMESLLKNNILELSEGEKQKTALASVLSLSPHILVLDEPTANLDPEATDELGLILQHLAAKGMTIFIVDHRLYWLKNIAHRVMIFAEGRLVKSGDFSILQDDNTRKLHGLRRLEVTDPRSQLPLCDSPGRNGISLTNLCFQYKKGSPLFRAASFQLPFGEIIAVLGRNGAGKTTFARLLTGLEKMESGTVILKNFEINPRKLLKRGSIVLQNTDHQLYMKTVREELSSSARASNTPKPQREIDEILALFGLDEFATRHPQSLSGGQKQRLVIACSVIKDPDILILDEPTSGLDGRNMVLISELLKKAAARGICVLVISHDLELIGLCATRRLDIPAALSPGEFPN